MKYELFVGLTWKITQGVGLMIHNHNLKPQLPQHEQKTQITMIWDIHTFSNFNLYAFISMM